METNLRKPQNESPNPAFSAILDGPRAQVYQMGSDQGKAEAQAGKSDEEQPAFLQRPDASLFTDLAQSCLLLMQEKICDLRNQAVSEGAPADKLSTPEKLQSYTSELNTELEQTEENEFFSKSLPLYTVFALLLCLGDVLMGDYLATQVLQAGDEAYWKGLLLGFFCIALGVVLEILVNNLYRGQRRWPFLTLITLIPLFTLFMFTGMGLLRATSLTLGDDPLASGGFPSWVVNSFFIGMSLAAPTALGCVLFVIQKKWRLNRCVRRIRRLLHLTGQVVNQERLLEQGRPHLAQDLAARYEAGYQKGKAEEWFRPPAPPVPAEAPPQGALVRRLRANILRKHGLVVLMLALNSMH